MGFNTYKKRFYLTALVLVMAVSVLFFCLNANGKTVKATTYETGYTVGTDFSFDFTDYDKSSFTGNSASWHNYVYKSENMRLSPTGNSLCAGEQSAPNTGEESGYLTYKITAGGNIGEYVKVFDALKVYATGRVFHYQHTNCEKCKMEVYLAVEDGDFELIKTIKAVSDSGSPLTRSFDFSEKVNGAEYCYVKLAFTGFSYDWVNLLNVTVDGDYYYKNYQPVNIEFVDADKDLTFSLNDEVTLKNFVGFDGEPESITVKDADGTAVAIDGNAFIVQKLGKYTVTYSFNDEGRTYERTYSVYCVEDASLSGLSSGKYGKYDNTDAINSDNYTVFDGGEVSVKSSTLKIEGSVAYKLPLDLTGNVTVAFSIDKISKGSVYELAFTDTVDTQVADYSAKGLYYKFVAEEVTEGEENQTKTTKYYVYGYYNDGSSLRELGKVEYSTFKGNNYVHIAPQGDSVTVTVNGVCLNSKCDYSSVQIDGFSTAKKTYVSYKVSDNNYLNVTNVINFADFDGYDKSVMLNVNNYITNDGSVTGTTEGVKLDGTVAYLLPIDFSSRFSFVFDFNAFPDGASVDVAFTATPGLVNFNTKTKKGLYYNFKVEGTNLLVSGYYQSGNEVVDLTQHAQSSIIGRHGFGLNRRTDQGITSFIDGTEIFSSQNYNSVVPADFTTNNMVYMCVKVVKTDFVLSNIVKSDIYTPILVNPYDMTTYTLRNYPSEGLVDSDFVLPDAITYDAVDGERPFNLTVYDSNGNTVECFKNSEGKTCFKVVYEGIYTVIYNSVDYAGNSTSIKKFITMELKSGAPKMYFSKSIDTFGRTGTAIKLPKPTIRVNGKTVSNLDDTIKITVIHPSGASITKNVNESFTPYDMGVYEIIYEVSNSVGVTHYYFSVRAKANVDEQDSYEDALKSENWVKYSDSVMEETADGLMIYGENARADEVLETAYCKLQFEMSSGIEITLDLTGLENKSEIDNWFSLGIGSEPAHGHFANQHNGYIYFMLYFEDGTYYVNAAYKSSNGGSNGLFGPIDMGTSGIVTISVEKLTGSTTLTDNVNIYLNHRKTAYGTETLISYSNITDDENFSYLSVFNYGVQEGITAKDFKSAVIREISVCDQESPAYSFNGVLTESVDIGATVVVPNITFSDNFDSDFVYSVMLVKPSGDEVFISNGSFVAEEKGVYYLVLRSYDKSGNYDISIFEIKSGMDGPDALTIALNVGGSVLALAVATVEIFFIIKILKKKRRG